MALSLNTIRELRGLITSERVTYRGNEVIPVANLVAELTQEEQALVVAPRVVPRAAAKED